MRKRFELPVDALDKDQIMNLIIKDDMEHQDDFQGDLAGYAEMHFGPDIFNNGFDRWENYEVQLWYYKEYIPDREADIAEGFYRGE